MTTKHELSKDNDVHSGGGWGKTTESQPHTAEKVRNVQSRRKSLPHGRTQKNAYPVPVVSPENIHISNIIQTEQVIFRYICVLCACKSN